MVLVAGLLALLLVVAGVLALLGQGSPGKVAPPSLVGQRMQAVERQSGFPSWLPAVGARGKVRWPWASHHGAVLLFFANWCYPCHQEVPTLARVVGRGHVGGVRIVGIDGDLSSGAAASFVSSNHVLFLVGHDAGLAVSTQLAPNYPEAIFVKPDGRVVEVHYGALSVMQLSAGLSKIGRS